MCDLARTYNRVPGDGRRQMAKSTWPDHLGGNSLYTSLPPKITTPGLLSMDKVRVNM